MLEKSRHIVIVLVSPCNSKVATGSDPGVGNEKIECRNKVLFVFCAEAFYALDMLKNAAAYQTSMPAITYYRYVGAAADLWLVDRCL